MLVRISPGMGMISESGLLPLEVGVEILADNGSINFGYAAERYPGLRLRPACYTQFTPSIMSIKFHEPSRKIIVANRAWPHYDACVSYFTPGCSSPADPGPTWVLDDGMYLAQFLISNTLPSHHVPGSLLFDR